MNIGISFKNLGYEKTGADIVMIEIVSRLQNLDSENQYYLFFTPPELIITARNFHLVNTSNLWQKPIFNIIWHQLILWLYVLKYKLMIIHLPYQRLPLYCPCFLVTTIHDLAEFRTKGHYDVIRRFYRKNYLRLMSKKVNHFVTVSNNSKVDIQEIWKVPAQKISIIFNGVSEKFRPLDKVICRSKLIQKYSLDMEYILYVGALEHPNKNLVRLIQSYSMAKKEFGVTCKLVLIGMERGNPQPIYDVVKDEKLEDDVLFLGYVDFDDLVCSYNCAEALIYPSLYEGFGFPPLEAMACGIPVGCSNTSSLPEVVGDAALLFDPYNVNEIKNTIILLLTDQGIRNQKINLGFKQVGLYSWDSATKKLLDVYHSFQISGWNKNCGNY